MRIQNVLGYIWISRHMWNQKQLNVRMHINVIELV